MEREIPLSITAQDGRSFMLEVIDGNLVASGDLTPTTAAEEFMRVLSNRLIERPEVLNALRFHLPEIMDRPSDKGH